jgi:hypothetical protein
MTNERKAELFTGLMEWVWMHTEGYGEDEYIRALENIGFTADEIEKELSDCCFDDDGDKEYIPSSTNGDYSPSNPWDAPGMKMKDFI